jgi:hypothetical protein
MSASVFREVRPQTRQATRPSRLRGMFRRAALTAFNVQRAHKGRRCSAGLAQPQAERSTAQGSQDGPR